MEKEKKPKKKREYKSPESRARQLAGLSGVVIEDHVPDTQIVKVNGEGLFATIPVDVRKQIIEMYCQGMSVRAIERKTGISKSTINDIKIHAIDEDSNLREKLFNLNLRQRLQSVVDGTLTRIEGLVDEMSAKDVVVAFGIAADKLMQLDKGKNPDQIHNHIHFHPTEEIANDMMNAMKPK
jgi:hypothetical protein